MLSKMDKFIELFVLLIIVILIIAIELYFDYVLIKSPTVLNCYYDNITTVCE